MLFWLVPAWAALALVYYLYQREFFLSALVSGVGVLGLWFVRHAGASSFYTIGAVAVILVLAVMMLWLKGHGGSLFSGEAGQLLPEEAGYPLMLLSCVISLAAIAIAAFVGGALSYYLLYAMVAWLFHPAAILRDPSRRPDTFMDLKSLQAKIREVCTHTYQ